MNMKSILVYFLGLLLFLSACQTNPVIPLSDSDSSSEPAATVSADDTTATLAANTEDDSSSSSAKEERGIGIAPTMTTGSDKPKVALVIGNSSYEYKPLDNPTNDAKDIADTLKNIGFDVDFKKNLNKRGMDDAIGLFVKRLTRQPGSVAFFYYAGHGVRVEGQNYLIPVDNDKIASETDVKYAGVDATRVLENMRASDTYLNIMVLDACRDNPYRSVTRGGLARGLAPMQQDGSIIAFAAKDGQTASDVSSSGRNGLYTSHLVKMLKRAYQQKMRIDDMFTEVRNAVKQESKDSQEPWSYLSWSGPYCFGGCQSTAPAAPVTPVTPPATVDNIRPTGKVVGINPDYQVGDTVKYNVTGADNKALKSLIFKVIDSSEEETWEVDGQTSIKKSSSFSTTGWKSGNYKYSLKVTDSTGNSTEETGHFTLKASVTLSVPALPVSPLPVPDIPVPTSPVPAVTPAFNCEDLQRKMELGSLSKKEEVFRQTHCR